MDAEPVVLSGDRSGASGAYLVAGALTPTNAALLAALRRRWPRATWIRGNELLERVRPGDTVVGRLDVLPTLDGIERGVFDLQQVQHRGARVLNTAGALFASHDKAATALIFGRFGIPHPRTECIDEGLDPREIEPPYVVKPRLGSRGREVYLCRTRAELARRLRRLRHRTWLTRHGALLQELVPPCGFDLRFVVAAGRVIGAAKRIAAPGEWRTNVAHGGRRAPFPVQPTEARELALRAAKAIGAGLVGVDLVRSASGEYVVLDLNATLEFSADYSLAGRNVFVDAVTAIVGEERARAAATAR